MRISLIGAGRVATHLAKALSVQHQILHIYSPTFANAQTLAEQVQAQAVRSMDQLDTSVELLIIAISDQAIESCVLELAEYFKETLIVHTSGSTHIERLTQHYARAGVFYPLQTFSLQREIDWTQTPLFIETACSEDLHILDRVAQALSQRVYHYDSKQRLSLHLAAVFACNFSNYCYDMAAQVLDAAQVDFSLLHPLMLETAAKATQNPPVHVQTGPAMRADENILNLHQQMLVAAERPDLQQVYQLLSDGILKRHHE
ncbi:putative short-subunit dehydrogenase-like oxidoreductase (DUF2520 family) [Acinetobacter calcoaceticus]|uniref:Putative short-subunit dehydrogenase-like oxidoreductase (DUF2520 family) n=1 Tax=Acinetobacter calcoaceticus TaxID=471 RepID=A0A4R1XT44_ACICA|nr:putative short-subunit dehydrogenase-like oxidoreductase (DUF2520 family) [Acinetobacter calcoaceticus]